jgi:hypothetical protein
MFLTSHINFFRIQPLLGETGILPYGLWRLRVMGERADVGEGVSEVKQYLSGSG